MTPAVAMSRRRLAAALLLGACAALPAAAFEINWGGSSTRVAGSGHPASETRPLADFKAIAVHGPMRLVVRQGAREAVEVRADDNLLPLIETRVEAGRSGRTLEVGIKKGHSLRTHNDIVVTVDVIDLRAIASSGSGDVKVESLKTPSLKLELSGSADAKLAALQTDELTLSVSGSGDIDAAGSATRLKASVAGSGDLRMAGLRADEVSISIAGSGDAEVTAQKQLDVSIAGSGDVVYHGEAKLKSSIAGSGSVSRR